ncbi:hypothetical protein ACFQ3Z_15080 [Streptomyces nogalater]
MRWDIAGSWISYAVPAVLFAVAFVIKLPLLRRAWQDPILRATAVLLGLGTLVFVSLPPPTCTASTSSPASPTSLPCGCVPSPPPTAGPACGSSSPGGSRRPPRAAGAPARSGWRTPPSSPGCA